MGSDLHRLLDPDTPRLYRGDRPILPAQNSCTSSTAADLSSSALTSSLAPLRPLARHPVLVHDTPTPIAHTHGQLTPPCTSRLQRDSVTALAPPAASWTAVNHLPRQHSDIPPQADDTFSREAASSHLPGQQPRTPPLSSVSQAPALSFASDSRRDCQPVDPASHSAYVFSPPACIPPSTADRISHRISPRQTVSNPLHHPSDPAQPHLHSNTPPSPAPSPISVAEAGARSPVRTPALDIKLKVSASPPSSSTRPNPLITAATGASSTEPHSSQITTSSDASVLHRRRARSVRFAEVPFDPLVVPPESIANIVTSVSVASPFTAAPAMGSESVLQVASLEDRTDLANPTSSGHVRQGGAPGCEECCSKIEEAYATMDAHANHREWSISGDALSNFVVGLEEHRALFPRFREKVNAVTSQCSQCSTMSSADQESMARSPFNISQASSGHHYRNKRKSTSAEGTDRDDEPTKARKLTPECTPQTPFPVLCQTTPPPEPGVTEGGGPSKPMSLQQANDLMVGLTADEPDISHVPTNMKLQRMSASLFLSASPGERNLCPAVESDHNTYETSKSGRMRTRQAKPDNEAVKRDSHAEGHLQDGS